MKNNKIGFDLIICLCSLTGLILNFTLFKTPVGLLYYTVFSNLLCFIFYLYSILKKKFSNDISDSYIRLKGLVLVSLIYTFIIYNFFMVPSGQVIAYSGHLLTSCFVHVFTPVLVAIDCIINGKSKMLKYSDLLLYLLFMFIYGILVLIFQHAGIVFPGNVNYPYFNFNYVEYGYVLCFIMNVIIVIIYEAIGFLVIFINRNIVKK